MNLQFASVLGLCVVMVAGVTGMAQQEGAVTAAAVPVIESTIAAVREPTGTTVVDSAVSATAVAAKISGPQSEVVAADTPEPSIPSLKEHERQLRELIDAMGFSGGTPLANAVGDDPRDSAEKSKEPALHDAATDRLLREWATNRADPRNFTVQCSRRTYDLSHRVEKISSGSIQWGSPENWELWFRPFVITKTLQDARNAPDAKVRRGPSGRPFQLKTISGDQLLKRRFGMLVHGNGEAELTASVPESDGDQGADPLTRVNRLRRILADAGWIPPLLFFQHPDDVRKRCDVRLTEHASQQADMKRFTARPLDDDRASCWEFADVVLDSQTWLPLHVKVVSSTGTTEAIYSFTDYKDVDASEDAEGRNESSSLDPAVVD